MTAEDLGFSLGQPVTASNRVVTRAKTLQAKKPSVPKYRDPKSGKTWTGHGKAPSWIVAAQKAGKILSFLIENQNASSVATGAKGKKAAVVKKAAPKKPAAKKASSSAKKAARTSQPAVVENSESSGDQGGVVSEQSNQENTHQN